MNRIVSKHLSIIIFLLFASVGIALALFVYRTTSDISDALAAEVLQQQADVAQLLQVYDDLILAVESERLGPPNQVNVDRVDQSLLRVELQLELMRFAYSFERLDGAAKAHAYVKPLWEDVAQWVSDGIPGVEYNRELIIAIAASRIVDRNIELRAIAKETNDVASELINTQTGYLDRFGTLVIFLVAAFSMLAVGVAALLSRQRDLQYRLAVDQQINIQRIKDFADTGADWFWEMNPKMRLRILSGKSLQKPASDSFEGRAQSSLDNPMPAFDHDIAEDHWPVATLYQQREFSEFESQWVTRDGLVRTISVSGKPRFNAKGEFEGYRGIGRDITARRQIELDLETANKRLINAETRGRQQAEQALGDSEMFLRTSLDALPQKLAIVDSSGVICVVNAAWESYAIGEARPINDVKAGYEQLERKDSDAWADSGINQHYTDVFARQSVEENYALSGIQVQIDQVLNGAAELLRSEVQINKPNQTVCLAIALSPFESNGNRYAVLSMEDISEQVKLEAQDRLLRAELAHYSRLTTIGELATGLAHELNQPLTAISHNCDALMSGINNHVTFDQDDLDAIYEIHSEADRAGAIIKGLRKMVRKETGGLVPTNINQLVAETMRLSLPDVTRYGIGCKLNLAEDLPQLLIDAVQIQQVLVNLERNAVDAIRLNDPKIREIEIFTRLTNDGFVKITVQDSGGGFTEEVRNNLFQPFLTTKKEGMGMGLSISRSLVESHGGQLWVDFEDTVMTTFNFTLPISSNQPVSV